MAVPHLSFFLTSFSFSNAGCSSFSFILLLLFLKPPLPEVSLELGLRSLEIVLAKHFLHDTASSLKLSIFGKVQGMDDSLVRIPVMFSELDRHDG